MMIQELDISRKLGLKEKLRVERTPAMVTIIHLRESAEVGRLTFPANQVNQFVAAIEMMRTHADIPAV